MRNIYKIVSETKHEGSWALVKIEDGRTVFVHATACNKYAAPHLCVGQYAAIERTQKGWKARCVGSEKSLIINGYGTPEEKQKLEFEDSKNGRLTQIDLRVFYDSTATKEELASIRGEIEKASNKQALASAWLRAKEFIIRYKASQQAAWAAAAAQRAAEEAAKEAAIRKSIDDFLNENKEKQIFFEIEAKQCWPFHIRGKLHKINIKNIINSLEGGAEMIFNENTIKMIIYSSDDQDAGFDWEEVEAAEMVFGKESFSDIENIPEE